MKIEINFLFLLILLFSVSCHNQYYLTDPEYNHGTKFSGILFFKGEFNPENYHYDFREKNQKK